jgi:hypothetical protein
MSRQTFEHLPSAGAAPPIVHDVLQGAGQPLGGRARAAFEPLLGHDLSRVRVHADAQAAASARAVRAEAYTVGAHIVLGGPQSDRLLAHELAHAVQQSGHAGPVPSPLRVAARDEPTEAEADAVARRASSGLALRVQQRCGVQLSRQEAATPAGATTPAAGGTPRRLDASAASVSWIDPASPAGARVPDPVPPATITVPFVTGNAGFRFSNYLHGWCETPDAVHLVRHDFAADSGLYRGPSYLGIPSWGYPVQRSSAPFTEAGIEGVDFEQTAGARTISPGVIGGSVGGLAGAGAGAWLGAKLGAGGGAWFGGVGALPGAVIGGVVGAGVGYLAGAFTASRATNFPPIWTRIRLRLKANGERRCSLLAHSVFPSNHFYCDLSQVSSYSALAPEQSSWEARGWDAGNPWGVSRPVVTP